MFTTGKLMLRILQLKDDGLDTLGLVDIESAQDVPAPKETVRIKDKEGKSRFFEVNHVVRNYENGGSFDAVVSFEFTNLPK